MFAFGHVLKLRLTLHTNTYTRTHISNDTQIPKAISSKRHIIPRIVENSEEYEKKMKEN